MTWRMPLNGKFNYGPKFGVKDNWHPNGHRGTDYNGFTAGHPYYAVNDGVIVTNKWSDVLGNVVVLQTGKQFFGYCHMDKPSPLAVGTKVKSGDQIGTAGTTGSASSGVHLHLTLGLTKEAVFGGTVYDADMFLKKSIAAQSAAPAPAAPAAPAPATSAPASYTYDAATPAATPAKMEKPALSGELKKGDEGDAVKYLQQQLKLPMTGHFDEVTYAATVTFQHHHPEITKPDGIVGQITWKAIG
jgi:Peptidase family M23